MEKGIIKQTKPQFPVRELLVVPHKGKNMALSFPAFGGNYYKENIEEMRKTYSHPTTGEKISFRPATISESISAAAYEFGSGSEADAKKAIFDPRWLQLGPIVKTSEGVWTNTKITDKSKLKSLLNGAKKVNGIYLLGNGMGFVPYESFETGVQDVDTFAQGGLARVLEHTNNKVATKLREIGSPKLYKEGINVWGWNNDSGPVIGVATLSSNGGLDDNRLIVDGGYWSDSYDGYAFGVLDKSRSDAPENKK